MNKNVLMAFKWSMKVSISSHIKGPGNTGFVRRQVLQMTPPSKSRTLVRHFDFIDVIYTEGEKVETVTDFIFLGSRITVDGDCGHEIERHLLLGRKALTDLNSI